MTISVEKQKVAAVIAALLYPALILAGFRHDGPVAIAVLPTIVGIYWLYRSDSLLVVFGSRFLFWPIALVQLVGWLWTPVISRLSLKYHIFDTGYFAHSGWALWNGILNHSVNGKPILADHFTPNLSLFGPLFDLYPTAMWLPYLKILLYFGCLPVIWKLSGYYTDNANLRRLALLAWLLSMPMNRVLGADVQPSTFAPFFILLAVLAWKAGKKSLAFLPLLFLLGFKEQMGLTWLCFGVWLLLFEKNYRTGLLVAAVGVVCIFAIPYWVMPTVTGHEWLHSGKFAPFALFPEKLVYTVSLLLSGGAAVLLVPRAALFVLPAAAASLVTNYKPMLAFNFHYQDLPATFLLLASLVALPKVQTGLSVKFTGKQFSGKAVSLFLVLAIILGFQTGALRKIRADWPKKKDYLVSAELNRLKPQIMPVPRVYAQDCLGAEFFNHPGVKSIFKAAAPINAREHRIIVLARHANGWPLKKKAMKKLLMWLERKEAEGKIKRLSRPGPLDVYEVPKNVYGPSA